MAQMYTMTAKPIKSLEFAYYNDPAFNEKQYM